MIGMKWRREVRVGDDERDLLLRERSQVRAGILHHLGCDVGRPLREVDEVVHPRLVSGDPFRDQGIAELGHEQRRAHGHKVQRGCDRAAVEPHQQREREKGENRIVDDVEQGDVLLFLRGGLPGRPGPRSRAERGCC